eukprot:jgi/Tetstr1/443310/TSEL_031325.t1
MPSPRATRSQSARRKHADTAKSVPSAEDVEEGDEVLQGGQAPRDADVGIVDPARNHPTGGAPVPPAASHPTTHTTALVAAGYTNPYRLPSDKGMAVEANKLPGDGAVAVPQDSASRPVQRAHPATPHRHRPERQTPKGHARATRLLTTRAHSMAAGTSTAAGSTSPQHLAACGPVRARAPRSLPSIPQGILASIVDALRAPANGKAPAHPAQLSHREPTQRKADPSKPSWALMVSRAPPHKGAAAASSAYQIPKLPLEEPPHTTLLTAGVGMNGPPQDIIVLVLNDYSNPGGIDITTENERRDANLTIFRSIQKMDAHHGHNH